MRLIAYDATQKDFLGASWVLGATLFRARGAADAVLPVRSWPDLFAFRPRGGELITELQLFGHGRSGQPLIANKGPEWHALVRFVTRFMDTRNGSVWFRSCSVAQGQAGKAFVGRLSFVTGVRVAAHTHIISALQSGLRVAVPEQDPSWDATEGLDPEGKPARSSVFAPRTYPCLTMRLPPGLIQ